MKTFDQFFDYDGWAIERILEFLKTAPGENPDALGLVAHILTSEQIWLLRMRGEDTSAINKSPELSVAECESLAREMRKTFSDFLSSLDEDDLEDLITYKNFSGAEFHTPLRDILMHVAMHGTYHRGQIARAIREKGSTPVNTDFITYVREKSGE